MGHGKLVLRGNVPLPLPLPLAMPLDFKPLEIFCLQPYTRLGGCSNRLIVITQWHNQQGDLAIGLQLSAKEDLTEYGNKNNIKYKIKRYCTELWSLGSVTLGIPIVSTQVPLYQIQLSCYWEEDLPLCYSNYVSRLVTWGFARCQTLCKLIEMCSILSFECIIH